MNWINKIKNDIQRPGGGWTFGFFSLGMVLVGLLASYYTFWIIGPIWSLIWFIIHMAWGANGYYPRVVQ
jgi:hypothetical protein